MDFSGTGQTSKAQPRLKAEEKIRRKLRRWFERCGRDLPWRQTGDPYTVMVSEFMLQQTTVAAVIPYFGRWMARFPTVEALGNAAEDDVLSLWQGLGYYSRARNLHRAAKALLAEHGGQIPPSLQALRSLPGVGAYTASAIRSFAFDRAEPVIDANIARVLARLTDWQKPVDGAAGRAFLRSVARGLLPRKGGRLHNSSLMDLGAWICVARNPRCPECPIRSECRARRPELLPRKKTRAKVEKVSESRAFIFEQGKLWLEKSPGPRWRGLWILPRAESTDARAEHVEAYAITHFRVRMQVFDELRNGRSLTGHFPDALPAMPSPHRRAVAAMAARVHNGACWLPK
jgi:A/G-specific adenine glycosylase